jgi:hypothetical protein
MIVPLFLSILLLLKLIPGLSKIGSPVVAMMVGVGAATLIGGSLMGTMVPQTMITIELLPSPGSSETPDLFNRILIVFGTAIVLISFQYFVIGRGENRNLQNGLMKVLSQIGKIFIAITFGVIFAGIYSATLSIVARWLLEVSRLVEQLL